MSVPARRRLKRLFALTRGRWVWLLLGIVLSLATLAGSVALMATSGWFITAMAMAGAAGATSFNYFTPAAIIRAAAIGRTLGRYGERLVTHEAVLRLLAGLRGRLFATIEPAAPAILDGLHGADAAGRLQADVDRLQGAYLTVLVPSAVFLVVLIAAPLGLGWLDPGLGFLALGGLLLGGVALPLTLWAGDRKGGGPAAEEAACLDALRGGAVDLVQGLPDLLACQAEGAWIAALEEEGRRLDAAQRRRVGREALGSAGGGLIAGLSLWGALLVGIPLVGAGALTAPQLTLVALLLMAVFEAAQAMPAVAQALPGVGRALARIDDLMSAAEAQPAPGTAPPPAASDLALKGVTFAYPRALRPVLKDLSLDLPAGGRLLVKGPSGAGKSSLIALITGLRRPDAGRLTLGGVDLAELDPEALRRRLAVAEQRVCLFSGSLRDNLLLGRPGAPPEALRRALALSGFGPVLEALPDGLDTQIGEGGRGLSGGEARRLGLARALVMEAPLLILDEPLEGLAPDQGRAILSGLAEALQGRTLIVISHLAVPTGLFDRTLDLSGPDLGGAVIDPSIGGVG
ncbi:thiol reductant ABC exporter subunit CydC [Roseospirillum parvum]|uniref:ATP-binding cassette, subfamily C, CydC n=1 Tax=Roseospirillum parvum TaxID=83401 RepID=A0A1G7WNK0_9PROT|nr:thiol reductant ABC exporter subunit CydC [Roseospirillum parvum]SDG73474.1 ATP-binding cassette, subfamily C, CydC [Roseospirillum parvum]